MRAPAGVVVSASRKGIRQPSSSVITRGASGVVRGGGDHAWSVAPWCKVRRRTALKERKRGIFYCKGRSFLHFHEDPAGLFADIAAGDGGEDLRLRVSTQRERQALLRLLDAALKSVP